MSLAITTQPPSLLAEFALSSPMTQAKAPSSQVRELFAKALTDLNASPSSVATPITVHFWQAYKGQDQIFKQLNQIIKNLVEASNLTLDDQNHIDNLLIHLVKLSVNYESRMDKLVGIPQAADFSSTVRTFIESRKLLREFTRPENLTELTTIQFYETVKKNLQNYLSAVEKKWISTETKKAFLTRSRVCQSLFINTFKIVAPLEIEIVLIWRSLIKRAHIVSQIASKDFDELVETLIKPISTADLLMDDAQGFYPVSSLTNHKWMELEKIGFGSSKTVHKVCSLANGCIRAMAQSTIEPDKNGTLHLFTAARESYLLTTPLKGRAGWINLESTTYELKLTDGNVTGIQQKMLMECCDGNCNQLFKLLHEQKEFMSAKNARQIARTLLTEFIRLHTEDRLVFRDFKPANVGYIRDANGMFSIKLLDPGLMASIGDASTGFTENYAPLEYLKSFIKMLILTKKPTTLGNQMLARKLMAEVTQPQMDIYALGLFFYQLYYGYHEKHPALLHNFPQYIDSPEKHITETLFPFLSTEWFPKPINEGGMNHLIWLMVHPSTVIRPNAIECLQRFNDICGREDKLVELQADLEKFDLRAPDLDAEAKVDEECLDSWYILKKEIHEFLQELLLLKDFDFFIKLAISVTNSKSNGRLLHELTNDLALFYPTKEEEINEYDLVFEGYIATHIPNISDIEKLCLKTQIMPGVGI